MVLPEFEYLVPTTIEEACNLQAELGASARVMAGGTDVVPPMKDGALKADYLINITRIPGLNALEYDEKEGLKIGCLTKLFDIQTSKLVQKVNPAVAQAAKYVATTQVRNKGTMVGNICNASPSCDTGSILIACDATIQITGAERNREVPAVDFFKGVKRTCLNPDAGEIVTGIVIPPLAEDEHAAYIKHAVRKAMDLAIVGVAAWVKTDGTVIKDIRLALGAVDITPIRAYKAEQFLIGKEITDENLNEAGIIAMHECHPIDDVRASADYRRDMVRVFVKRAVKKALEGYEEGSIT